MTRDGVSDLVEGYRRGTISRRGFIRSLVAMGIALPAAASIAAACAPTGTPGGSPAGTQAAGSPAVPTRRGGGGTLRLLSYSGVKQLNPHHNIQGEQNESRLAQEPLAAFDEEGRAVPILGAELPTVDKGTLDPNGKFVTWRLKKDVLWHDGQPFTADDVVFTWEYAADTATGATSRGNYTNVASIDKVDSHTVKVNFKDPTPLWFTPFVGNFGPILPKHVLSQYKGQNARNAPFGLKPIGTGPYKILEIRAGDLVIAELNDKYHVPNRPFFDRIEFKSGGGDATAAARAVLQTGEFDFTFNLHVGVEREILDSIAKSGAGKVIVMKAGISTEHLQLNPTDPNKDVDGERSSIKSQHPFFSDLKVRQAMQLAFDRQVLADQFGPAGSTPALYMGFHHEKYMPPGSWKYDPKAANDLLDQAGWRRGSDGVRAKDGVRMKILYVTSVDPLRQKVQAVVKKDLEALGFQVELKAVPSAVFFSTDPATTDSYFHFRSDIQQYSASLGSPDPQQFFGIFLTSRIPQKANNWGAGANTVRFRNAEYDKLWQQAQTESNEAKRTDMFRQMNKLMSDDASIVPLFHRKGVAATSAKLRGVAISPWDALTWNIGFWDKTP